MPRAPTPDDPGTIQLILGALALLVFSALAIADLHPRYEASFYLAALLVLSYLMLLGLGATLARLIEARYGGGE